MKRVSKFIYLISPNKIYNNFYFDLKKILETRKVKYFQLRLKKAPESKILTISKKIKKMCKKHNVKFILNDNPVIAKKIHADGCHLGQSDMPMEKARKHLKNKIIGITCHNSIYLSKKALKNNADYIAIGAFYKSFTKKVKYKATVKILKKIRKISNKPIIAIGGINDKNYKKLLLNKADFLAISSFIWKNKKLTPREAMDKIK